MLLIKSEKSKTKHDKKEKIYVYKWMAKKKQSANGNKKKRYEETKPGGSLTCSILCDIKAIIFET